MKKIVLPLLLVILILWSIFAFFTKKEWPDWSSITLLDKIKQTYTTHFQGDLALKDVPSNWSNVSDSNDDVPKDHGTTDDEKLSIQADPYVAERVWPKSSAEKAMGELLKQESYADGTQKALMLALQEYEANWSKTNPAFDVYKDLTENFSERLLSKTPVEQVYPLDGPGTPREIVVRVVDEAGDPVEGFDVSLWWWLVWTTWPDGEVSVSWNIPDSHEYLYIQADKPWYTEVYDRDSLVFRESETVNINLNVSNTYTDTVSSSTDNAVQVETDDIVYNANTDCSLLDTQGNCYEGDVEVEYTYYDDNAVNMVSMPMQAMIDGEIVTLTSNGMAFMNFEDTDGNTLIHAGEDSTICYKVPQEDIDAWADTPPEEDIMNGYWYFDESTWYWKYDDEAKITITDGLFCAQTKHIY